jgi:hypothetical protein
MKGSPPLLITLEIARVSQVGDPYAFRPEAQEYLMRSEGGGFESMRFDWDERLLSDLSALRNPGCDPEIPSGSASSCAAFWSRWDGVSRKRAS